MLEVRADITKYMKNLDGVMESDGKLMLEVPEGTNSMIVVISGNQKFMVSYYDLRAAMKCCEEAMDSR